jgi:hypothetical protein
MAGLGAGHSLLGRKCGDALAKTSMRRRAQSFDPGTLRMLL